MTIRTNPIAFAHTFAFLHIHNDRQKLQKSVKATKHDFGKTEGQPITMYIVYGGLSAKYEHYNIK